MANDGDTVTVHYRGTLDNGEEFDSSRGREPLTFVVGKGQVISGFDDAVRGLSVGQNAKVRLEPDKAEYDVDSNAFQSARPRNVVLFVKARLELDDGRDLLAVLRRGDQRVNDRAVAGAAI